MARLPSQVGPSAETVGKSIGHLTPTVLIKRPNAGATKDLIRFEDEDGLVWAFMDSRGTFSIGPNYAYRRKPTTPSSWGAVDFLMAQTNIRDGGPGRIHGRSGTWTMVNDPADNNLRRANGTPGGNFVTEHSTYTTGTATVTNGNIGVTGVGTLWLANVRVGDSIQIGDDSTTRIVAAVLTNTSLQLDTPYGGTGGSGKTYVVNGTVDVTGSSRTVTGHNTRWLSQDTDNKILKVAGGPEYRIVEIVSDTELTLDDPYTETTKSDQTFVIGFNGYPYGQNFDGTGLYELNQGAVVGSCDALPYVSAGTFPGGAMRFGMSLSEDPFVHILKTTLSQPWNPGDAQVHLADDPLAIHISQLNTRGEDQGNYPLRPHGFVTIKTDSGKTAQVAYAARDSATNRLMGCDDTSTAGTASVGSVVTQVRTQHAGRWDFTPTHLGMHINSRQWRLNSEGNIQHGLQAINNNPKAFHHVKGGGYYLEQPNGPTGAAYSFVGTSAGSFRRNYYIVQKNGLSTDAYADTAPVLKVSVPDGLGSYGINNFLKLTWDPGDGWAYVDVIRVIADASQVDVVGATYERIAKDLPLADDNTTWRGIALDTDVVIDTVPAPSRPTGADMRVAGFMWGEAGRAGGVRRITSPTADNRIPGQQFSIDGREEFVSVETTGAALDFYLPAVSTRPGRVIEIADKGGAAATFNFTIHASGADLINGSSTYTINTNRGGVRLWSNGGTAWIAIGTSATPAAGTPIDQAIIDAKGDLIVGTANDAITRKAVGANNTALFANSGQTGGVEWRQLVNADVATGAAIAYAKLALAGSIVNADIAGGAAIAYSKLNLATSILNSDVAAGAAINYSKLNLTSSILNADINGAANIAYSKLNLATSIVNADINGAAAINYAKLNLTNNIVNADVSSTAAIVDSKLNLVSVDSRWRPLVPQTMSRVGSGVVAGTYALQPGTSIALQTAASLTPVLVYIDSGDLGVSGRATQLRLVASVLVNDTAPGVSFTFGLYPVGTPSGAAANVVNPNFGAVIAASGVAFAAPAANSKPTPNSSGAFAAPANGWYGLGFVLGGTTAVNSSALLNYRLEYQNV